MLVSQPDAPGKGDLKILIFAGRTLWMARCLSPQIHTPFVIHVVSQIRDLLFFMNLFVLSMMLLSIQLYFSAKDVKILWLVLHSAL